MAEAATRQQRDRRDDQDVHRGEEDVTLLRSAADVEQAQVAGALTLEPGNVVINAPVLTWPGGNADRDSHDVCQPVGATEP